MPGKKKRIQHHEIVGEFAQCLRAARKRLGLSQYDLALKAGMALTYIGKLERAESAAGIDTVARLSEAMGVSVASLVGGRGKREPDMEVVAKLLRQGVEKILKKNSPELAQALTVVVGALGKGNR